MAKTRRLIREHLKLVDAVIELRDARIVQSSRNPEIDRLTEKKPRVVLLNKADCADEHATRRWCDVLQKDGVIALAADSKSGRGLGQIGPAVKKAAADRLASLARRGMGERPLRLMVGGIPNVGKSSFINRMAGSRKAKVEDRPGVTRGPQWVRLADGMELLDMPGVLWPKFEDKTVGLHLAWTGAIRDAVMDTEELAARLAAFLYRRYPRLLAARYSLGEGQTFENGHEILEQIARNRGMLLPGSEIDLLRAAVTLLDEFRGAKIGRISLETPEDGR
jgi:ribosome biogenesis GTPase A